MGRNKYTEEERDAILKTFIRASREIIETEGLEQVSTRKLAKITGFNSAKLYFYFENLDDLIAMATISNLERYISLFAHDLPKIKTPLEFILHSWEIFCHCAFDEPQIYYHIFFGRHGHPLHEIMDEYYRLYPHHLDEQEEKLLAICKSADLKERNMIALQPLAEDGLIKAEHIKYINDFIVSYFKSILEERMGGDGGLLEEEELTRRFMGGLHMILGLEAK